MHVEDEDVLSSVTVTMVVAVATALLTQSPLAPLHEPIACLRCARAHGIRDSYERIDIIVDVVRPANATSINQSKTQNDVSTCTLSNVNSLSPILASVTSVFAITDFCPKAMVMLIFHLIDDVQVAVIPL